MKFCVNPRFIFQVKDNQNSFFLKAVSIFLLVTLRYIIFFFLLLLGCSDQGKFGENCSMSCPPNCLKSRCDITKGTCFECIVGYLGPTCESNTIITKQLFFLKLLMLLWWFKKNNRSEVFIHCVLLNRWCICFLLHLIFQLTYFVMHKKLLMRAFNN